MQKRVHQAAVTLLQRCLELFKVALVIEHEDRHEIKYALRCLFYRFVCHIDIMVLGEILEHIVESFKKFLRGLLIW